MDQFTQANQGQFQETYASLTDSELAVVEHASEIVLNAMLKSKGTSGHQSQPPAMPSAYAAAPQ